jgi:hypothetical protein
VTRPAAAPTPGPWAVGFSDGSGQTYITAGDHPAREDLPVVVVSGGEDSWGVPQGVENPADARLISAAPELLACAKRSAAALLSAGVEDDGNPDNPLGQLLRETLAALAKAGA